MYKPTSVLDSESLMKFDKTDRMRMLASGLTRGKVAAKVDIEVHGIIWAWLMIWRP